MACTLRKASLSQADLKIRERDYPLSVIALGACVQSHFCSPPPRLVLNQLPLLVKNFHFLPE